MCGVVVMAIVLCVVVTVGIVAPHCVAAVVVV